jgi:hypothetical protein
MMTCSISRFAAVACFGIAAFGAVPGIANAVTVQPALVRDVDEGALQPFQASLLPHSSSSGQGIDSVTVPAGKRLVIEYYSAQAQDLSGGAAAMTLGTTVGGVFVSYIVYVNANTTNQVTQTTKIYADPGTVVQAFAFNNGGSCGGLISISGHLVNLP